MEPGPGLAGGETGLPGVVKDGRYITSDGYAFFEEHDPDKSVTVTLDGETYRKVVFQVEDKEAAARMISEALSRKRGKRKHLSPDRQGPADGDPQGPELAPQSREAHPLLQGRHPPLPPRRQNQRRSILKARDLDLGSNPPMVTVDISRTVLVTGELSNTLKGLAAGKSPSPSIGSRPSRSLLRMHGKHG